MMKRLLAILHHASTRRSRRAVRVSVDLVMSTGQPFLTGFQGFES